MLIDYLQLSKPHSYEILSSILAISEEKKKPKPKAKLRWVLKTVEVRKDTNGWQTKLKVNLRVQKLSD